MKTIVSVLLALLFVPFHSLTAQTWTPVGDILNNTAKTLEVIGNELYVGGAFTQVGSTTSYGIAVWDGSSYTKFNSRPWFPAPGNQIEGFAELGGNVITYGSFNYGGSNPAYIAQYDGTKITDSTLSLNATTFCSYQKGTETYFGGAFSTNFGWPHDLIMAWTGSSYNSVGNGLGIVGYVLDLEEFQNEIYAVGTFSRSSPSNVDDFAKFNGTSWSTVVGPSGGFCRTMKTGNSNLFVGGSFTQIGTVLATGVAAWDGSSLTQVGNGLTGGTFGVTDLEYYNGMLYAAGDFITSGGSPTTYVAQWDGTAWTQVGTGLPGWVWEIEVFDSELYAVLDSVGSGGNIRLWKCALPATSVDAPMDFQVEIYPNPASEQLTIRIPEAGMDRISATLRDVQGRVLRQLESARQAFQWDISDLPAGIYSVEIWGDSGRTVKKVSVL